MGRHLDTVTGLVLVGFSGVVYFIVKDFPTGTAKEGMGARLLPLLLTILLALLSISLLIQGLIRRRKGSGEAEVSPPLLGAHLKIPAVLVVLLILYLLALDLLGFLIATPVFLIVVMRVLGSAWRSSALLGVSFTAFIYLIFSLLFQVPLPTGSLLE